MAPPDAPSVNAALACSGRPWLGIIRHADAFARDVDKVRVERAVAVLVVEHGHREHGGGHVEVKPHGTVACWLGRRCKPLTSGAVGEVSGTRKTQTAPWPASLRTLATVTCSGAAKVADVPTTSPAVLESADVQRCHQCDLPTRASSRDLLGELKRGGIAQNSAPALGDFVVRRTRCASRQQPRRRRDVDARPI